MKHVVTLIPGEGVGPEVVEAARRVLEATGIEFGWETVNAGASALGKEGSLLPERVLESIRKNKVALKGPTTTPVGTGFRSVNVALRKELDLYACLRPCRSYAGIPSRYENVDIVVVRENTEDLYAGIEFEEGTPEAGKPSKSGSWWSSRGIIQPPVKIIDPTTGWALVGEIIWWVGSSAANTFEWPRPILRFTR